jgi:hypothetical protein
MEQRVNRVNEAVRSWDQIEKDHGVLYPESVGTPASARTRLKELEIIQARFRNTRDPVEKISLLFLKDETSRLRKEALKSKYNWRYIVNFLLKPFTVNKIAAKRNRLEVKNNENFIQSIRKKGFGLYADEIIGLIKQGKKDFSFTVPFQNNETEVTNFKMNINYDPIEGHSFKSVQAQHFNKMNPGDIRNHQMSVLQDIPGPHIISNLMAGRSTYDQRNGWMQFDLTDKDENGNYRMKTVDSNGFDIDKSCENLPFWDKLKDGQQVTLPMKLQMGNRQPVTYIHNGVKNTVFLEASPIKKEILAFNEHGKALNLQKLHSPGQKDQTLNSNMKVVKAPSLEKNQGRQKVSNQRTSKQTLGKGVKPRSFKVPR